MVCDVLLHRLCGLTCHLFDLIGAAVVPVGAVQPGHGGDVLLDVGRNAHRFQDLFEPFVVGQIHSRDRVSQRLEYLSARPSMSRISGPVSS